MDGYRVYTAVNDGYSMSFPMDGSHQVLVIEEAEDIPRAVACQTGTLEVVAVNETVPEVGTGLGDAARDMGTAWQGGVLHAVAAAPAQSRMRSPEDGGCSSSSSSILLCTSGGLQTDRAQVGYVHRPQTAVVFPCGQVAGDADSMVGMVEVLDPCTVTCSQQQDNSLEPSLVPIYTPSPARVYSRSAPAELSVAGQLYGTDGAQVGLSPSLHYSCHPSQDDMDVDFCWKEGSSGGGELAMHMHSGHSDERGISLWRDGGHIHGSQISYQHNPFVTSHRLNIHDRGTGRIMKGEAAASGNKCNTGDTAVDSSFCDEKFKEIVGKAMELKANHQGNVQSQSQNCEYYGVSRHRKSGRFEASIWVQGKGKQVYLGGFDCQEAAACAYDILALKVKGGATKTNFGEDIYASHKSWIEATSFTELVNYTKRQSGGFARGKSKFRGVTHHNSGRWEARVGVGPRSPNVPKIKLYLGVYPTEELAAQQYDRALVRLKGRSAATNFLIHKYEPELEQHERMEEYMARNGRASVNKEDMLGWIKTGISKSGI